MTQTIGEQFKSVCDGHSETVVCPQCWIELLRQYGDDGAYSMLEEGKCPMCDCTDCTGEHKWCPECNRKEDCEGYQKKLAEKAEFEYYETKRQDEVAEQLEREFYGDVV